MKRTIVELLASPKTGNPLELEVFVTDEASEDEIMEGRLIDRSTGEWFRIEQGIVDLVPLDLRRHAFYDAFAKRHGLDYVMPNDTPETRDQNAVEQIGFFSDYHSDYEDQVVDSPYYKVMDAVTFGDWTRQNVQPGDHVVEIGCGSGRQTVPLLDCGARVIAVDLTEEMLRVARKKALVFSPEADVNYIVGSAEALPLKATAIDAAVIYGSLHHFSNPEKALENAGAILRPGGKFYMLEPHNSPVRPVFDWMMKKWTLWEEEASDEPLFDRGQFTKWLGNSDIDTGIKYTTYLPPHLFYGLSQKFGEVLLRTSDRVFSALPGIRLLAGVIIAEGTKRTRT